MKLHAFAQFGSWFLRTNTGDTIAALSQERDLAREIARRVNAHDALVAACRDAVAMLEEEAALERRGNFASAVLRVLVKGMKEGERS